jgi:hypothetical protein
MGCVIDHLMRDHEIRVLKDFVDLRGVRHAAGDLAVLRDMEMDWNQQEISLEWERTDGSRETLFFSLKAKEGPRSGAMREFFQLGPRVPLPEDTPAGRAAHRRTAAKALTLPEVAPELITSPSLYEAAIQRIWALAARKRFDEAEDQLRAVADFPDAGGYELQRLAENLAEITILHRDDEDAEVYRWLREHTRNYCYAFGSGATSGGEGAVSGEWIRRIEARLPER